MKAPDWLNRNTFHHSAFIDKRKLVEIKERKGLKISLALPTLNEETSIGKTIVILKAELQKRYPLLDEMAVVDSGSTDRTREVAAKYGADVHLAEECLPELKTYTGKGENLWKSLYILSGDIIVWIDADITDIHPKFVYGVLGPLLLREEIKYVKAFYQRPLMLEREIRTSGGGRVTEILVRPLFSAFYPELASLLQPLSGEYAGRREVLESLPFQVGYGVETGLLMDIYLKYGQEAIAQVDMDSRIHRNRSLADLGKMAFGILHTFFSKAAEHGKLSIEADLAEDYIMVRHKGGEYFIEKERLGPIHRPPMITVDEYRKKRGLLSVHVSGSSR